MDPDLFIWDPYEPGDPLEGIPYDFEPEPSDNTYVEYLDQDFTVAGQDYGDYEVRDGYLLPRESSIAKITDVVLSSPKTAITGAVLIIFLLLALKKVF